MSVRMSRAIQARKRKVKKDTASNEGVDNQLTTMQTVSEMRTAYDNIIKQQFDAQRTFGKSFSLKGVDEEIQRSVINNTRAITKLNDTSTMAKLKGVVSRIPVLGKLIDESYQFIGDEALRNQRIDEITDGIFKTIRDKQKTVVDYCDTLDRIKDQSIDSHDTLVTILTEMVDVKPEELSTEDNNFIIEANKQEVVLRDRIVKMQATIAAAKQLSARISNMIPTLQDDMFNQLALNQTLNGIRSMSEQLNATVDATDKIAMDNDSAVKEALIAVTKSINTGDDYKRILKRNEDFIEFSGTLRELVVTQQTQQHALVNHLKETNIAQLEKRKQEMLELDYNTAPKYSEEQNIIKEQAEKRVQQNRK